MEAFIRFNAKKVARARKSRMSTTSEPGLPWFPISRALADRRSSRRRGARAAAHPAQHQEGIEGLRALTLALSMIDLTTLEGADSPGKVKQGCWKAAHLHDAMQGLPHIAAVCAYPTLLRLARQRN
jgi:deoxyribose-phosphate aldolase